MNVLLIEPYYAGSHRQWADGYAAASGHNVKLLTLSGAHWKWRMHGAAITLSERFKRSEFQPDVVLATDMLDVATFVANCRERLVNVPIVTYFHENQLTYPWSETDKDVKLNRDNHYAFINYTSALVSNRVFFNSKYHQEAFLGALPGFLKQFPDNQNLETLDQIRSKSEVIHLGMDLARLDVLKPEDVKYEKRATILWNHRWEYDKNPEEFFSALREVKNRGWEFNLVVLGESFRESPAVFEEAKIEFDEGILHWGYVDSIEEYAHWLWRSDILPVTSNQDFFGGSVAEAMYCNVKPLIPDRLAYPEHFPDSVRSVFLYQEGELVSKLQRWIKDVNVLRKQQTRSFVEKYDWAIIAKEMDERWFGLKKS
ncbi:MAG: DUF3524 domain-containing protein [Flavobacteriales bacterium]|nr:DUF3524 domain-containing protein [Flavobacteriales bacterium]MCB9191630.1 DUF3524 domain-containing protein [Flavobacteriales bacterium]MCB9204444.1 DUF3524 domain-containing protein [Flavobacteriales bacterium]